jgi:hypothetical protein
MMYNREKTLAGMDMYKKITAREEKSSTMRLKTRILPDANTSAAITIRTAGVQLIKSWGSKSPEMDLNEFEKYIKYPSNKITSVEPRAINDS